ncbi:MAG TPA: anti-sigma factor, partial [Candidatus Acidoferrales bacterium]|nr:anti-sigma factor [Candidatus Acidoferrales bacterium]
GRFETGVDVSAQHPIREEDLELLALGVIDGEECRDLRAHIASCAECAGNFAAAQGRVALFAFAAPPQNPSSGARERLLEKIRAEEAPATESRSGKFASSAGHPAIRWWNSFWIPATAILAVATILLWVNDRRMDDQLQKMRETEQMFEQEMHRQRELVSFFSAGDTKAVSLSPKAKSSSDWARLSYNARMGMVCYTGDLPAPPPDKEYQMWIVPMVGSPISAGAFMPAAFNKGHMCMAKMPQGITCKDFGVTIEPMGGMPYPTGRVVLASAP